MAGTSEGEGDTQQDGEAGYEAWHKMGNESYLGGRLSEAIFHYSKAIRCHELHQLSEKARVAMTYSNRAQAYLQLHDHTLAAQDCSQALDYDPANVKALIRRATARIALEQPDQALNDIEAALSLKPGPALMRTVMRVREEARTMCRRLQEPDVVDAPAKDAEGLVHEQQTLRLFFKTPPPARVSVGAWWPLSVYLANEFGLWRRSDFPLKESHGDTLPLNLSTIATGEGSAGSDSSSSSSRASLLQLEVQGGRWPVFVRGTGCRAEVKVRFCFRAEEEEEGMSWLAVSPRMVHVKVALGKEEGAGLLKREVLPVFSLPVEVMTAPAVYEALEPGSAGATSCRGVEVPALGPGRRLLVAEAPGQLGLSGKVWDASLVLLHYMMRELGKRAQGPPLRCLELGAGTGLAGIACALLGADVTITDLDMVVPLIELNIGINPSGASGAARAVAHRWGDESLAGLEPPYECIVMSDVVYDPVAYQPLVDSLVALSGPSSRVILAHRHRHPDDALFFEAVQKHFAMEVALEGKECEGVHAACADVKVIMMTPLGCGNGRRKDE